MRIDRQVVHLHDGVRIQAPKAAAGHRTVVFPRLVAAKLAQHLEEYVRGDAGDPVFARPRAA